VTSRAQTDPVPQVPSAGSEHTRFGSTVRLAIAPLVLCSSGFFTADFLLSGMYTWPRTTRVIVLTITLTVLAYEFVYKEQRLRYPIPSDVRPLKAVLYSCVFPYALGALALIGLARLI
jgi:hypothetical protein